MKKWIFPTFLFLFSFASGSEAQERTTLETCFITMPDALLPQLDVNARKDLLDLHKAGHAASVKGRMGDITLERLDEKMLLLSLSEKSTMQIALLPTKSSPVVAVVQTVKMPAADSRIDFYDTSWTARALPRRAPKTFLSEAGRKKPMPHNHFRCCRWNTG